LVVALIAAATFMSTRSGAEPAAQSAQSAQNALKKPTPSGAAPKLVRPGAVQSSKAAAGTAQQEDGSKTSNFQIQRHLSDRQSAESQKQSLQKKLGKPCKNCL
jgi:hypothetical protein